MPGEISIIEGALKKLSEPVPSCEAPEVSDVEQPIAIQIHPNRSSTDNRLYLEVKVGTDLVNGLLDIGASANCLGRNAMDIIDRQNLMMKPSSASVRLADGQAVEVVGSVELPMTVGDETISMKFNVIPSLHQVLILGIPFFDQFDLWRRLVIPPPKEIRKEEVHELCPIPVTIHDLKTDHKLDETQIQALLDAVGGFNCASDGVLGRTPLIKHRIETFTTRGIKQRPFELSPAKTAILHKEIDKMLEMNIIEPIIESEWANNVVMVEKEGGEVRMCFDGRKLNEVTKRDTYPTAHLGRILTQLPTSPKYITKIDLEKAFWQVELEPNSRAYTTITVPGRGLFQYLVMPQGLLNSAQTLQKLIDKIVSGLEAEVKGYLDDLLIITSTFERHIEVLRIIADRLRAAKLTINVKKSKFCQSRVRYLGYVISEDGLECDTDKIAPIMDLPSPKDLKSARALIGCLNWYKRFIDDLSGLMSPISDTTKTTKGAFKWTAAAEESFVRIKKKLTTAPILVPPDFHRPFYIHADASDLAAGMALMQRYGEEEKVVAYHSRKFTDTQRRYNVTEKECLAVVLAIDKFRPYVDGTRFYVITDHHSLCFLRRITNGNRRLLRWQLELAAYDFEIIHRRGKDNTIPDFLSRYIEALEEEDPAYDVLRSAIVHNPELYPHLRVEGDKIFRHSRLIADDGGFSFTWREYVRLPHRLSLVRSCHEVELCHLGFYKTLQRLKTIYFWPKMSSDVSAYISSCEVCKQSKPANSILRPVMGLAKAAFYPMQYLALDFIQGLPRSLRGNKELLVVTDVFSKFSWLQPMRRVCGEKVVEFLEHSVFRVFGTPQVVHTDNATYFRGRVFQAFLADWGVTHIFTPAHCPRPNNAERTNRIVEELLRAALVSDSDQRRWEEHVGRIEMALRISQHEATRETPYRVVFGRDYVSSGDQYEGQGNRYQDNSLRAAEMNRIWEDVQNNLDRARLRSCARYDQGSRVRRFDVGQVVWKREFPISRQADNFNYKLAPRFRKVRIGRVMGSNSYEVEDMEGHSLGVYSAEHLKD